MRSISSEGHKTTINLRDLDKEVNSILKDKDYSDRGKKYLYGKINQKAGMDVLDSKGHVNDLEKLYHGLIRLKWEAKH